MSKMTLTTEADTHIVVTRRFAASPDSVSEGPRSAPRNEAG